MKILARYVEASPRFLKWYHIQLDRPMEWRCAWINTNKELPHQFCVQDGKHTSYDFTAYDTFGSECTYIWDIEYFFKKPALSLKDESVRLLVQSESAS
jgi:hypothetical protein